MISNRWKYWISVLFWVFFIRCSWQSIIFIPPAIFVLHVFGFYNLSSTFHILFSFYGCCSKIFNWMWGQIRPKIYLFLMVWDFFCLLTTSSTGLKTGWSLQIWKWMYCKLKQNLLCWFSCGCLVTVKWVPKVVWKCPSKNNHVTTFYSSKSRNVLCFMFLYSKITLPHIFQVIPSKPCILHTIKNLKQYFYFQIYI